jgi:hypothetical protein
MNDPWKYGTSRKFRRALRDASMVKLCEKLHPSEMVFSTCLTSFDNCPFFLKKRIELCTDVLERAYCLAPDSAQFDVKDGRTEGGFMRNAHGMLRGCYLWLFNIRGEEAVRRLETWKRRAKHSGTR